MLKAVSERGTKQALVVGAPGTVDWLRKVAPVRFTWNPVRVQEFRDMENGINGIVGETAGRIWYELRKNGGIPMRNLGRAVDSEAPVTQMAVGWLAREGKINIQRKGKQLIVTLTEVEASVHC